MHSAHCMLTLLSCSAIARLVVDSVTSMRKFPASFNLAWHDVHSLMSYSKQTNRSKQRRKWFQFQTLDFIVRVIKDYFELFIDRIPDKRLPSSPPQDTGQVSVSVPATSVEKRGTCCKSPTLTPLSPSSIWQPSQAVWSVPLHVLLPSPDEQQAGSPHLGRNRKCPVS